MCEETCVVSCRPKVLSFSIMRCAIQQDQPSLVPCRRIALHPHLSQHTNHCDASGQLGEIRHHKLIPHGRSQVHRYILA